MSFTIKSNKGLPKTGQTVVYQTGDDGTYQAGFPLSGTTVRFVDNGNNTITDTMAGLQWVKNPELIIPTDNGTIGPVSPPWTIGSGYVSGDVVYYGPNVYGASGYPYSGASGRWLCISGHTASNFVSQAGDWIFQTYGNDTNQIISFRGSWNSGVHYNNGDSVSGSNSGTTSGYFVNAVDHTSVTSGATWTMGEVFTSGDIRRDGGSVSGVSGTGWRYTGSGYSGISGTTYASGVSYSSGSQSGVANDGMGVWYKSISGHTSSGSSISDDEAGFPFSWDKLGTSGDVFAYDRSLNSGWVEYYTGEDFAHELVDHPTYWISTPWISGSSGATVIPQLVNWSSGINQCEALNYAGYSDWKLPNANELLSLRDYAEGNSGTLQPFIYSGFRNIQYPSSGSGYWTSTSDPTSSGANNAVFVNFSASGSDVFTTASNLKTFSGWVLPCRSI